MIKHDFSGVYNLILQISRSWPSLLWIHPSFTVGVHSKVDIHDILKVITAPSSRETLKFGILTPLLRKIDRQSKLESSRAPYIRNRHLVHPNTINCCPCNQNYQKSRRIGLEGKGIGHYEVRT